MTGETLLPYRPAHLPQPVVPGSNAIKSSRKLASLVFDKNVDIPIPRLGGTDVCRCNVYRPLDTEEGKKYPVIITAGPYGKDIPYEEFYPESFAELPAGQKSGLSAWETPEPTYWTAQGYVIVRVDEQGVGESPGYLDTMSDQTANNFFHCIEWAASQPWSTGKVGLLGISYYAGSQWRVAARKPKGLTCIIPWEGMSDYYRDRVRHGGILSDGFVRLWQNYQVNTNQYGRHAAPAPAKTWGPGRNKKVPSIEGTLSPEQLAENRTDQTADNVANSYMDDTYYASRDFNLADIEVPLLSVANWGGICLHLRGNVLGYLGASSKNKWLWFITGRHDLPFYLEEYVALQKSFLDTWLHERDDRGWSKGPNAQGGVPAINMRIREGTPKFNTIDGDRSFPTREAHAWPLPNTKYAPYYLSEDGSLVTDKSKIKAGKLSYAAKGNGDGDDGITFSIKAENDVEIAGHPTLRLIVNVEEDGNIPSDIDLFVTLRHLDTNGQEIFYTGTAGDPCPVTKGWLRGSVRKVNPERSTEYLPYREYLSTDVAPLKTGAKVAVDVEIWPTSVVVPAGNTIQLQIGPKDQQGAAVFTHASPVDRSPEKFAGRNSISTGAQTDVSDTIGINDKTPALGSLLVSALVLPTL